MTGSRGPRILLVDLYHGGHHAQYVGALLDYWREHEPAGELHALVSNTFADKHAALVAAFEGTQGAHAHPVATPAVELQSPLRNDLMHGRIVADYASRLDADHVLFMYFDHVQVSLARGLRLSRPTQISGIYFRPTFHYRDLGLSNGRRDEAVALRKQIVLRLALRNPHVRTVFVLDPFAAERLARRAGRAEFVHLPEPLSLPATERARAEIADRVEPGRRMLLLFGSLDDRKGIRPVLDALAGLPDHAQAQVALVLAGRFVGPERDDLLRQVFAFRDASQVQVLVDDRFLAEDEIQPLFASSDLVLLTYDRHVGSSGVLVRAAAAGVPVLSTGYGLLGAQVARFRLGATVAEVSADSIRSTLAAWLEEPASIPFDRHGAAEFAGANTADAFAETIFSRLLRNGPAGD